MHTADVTTSGPSASGEATASTTQTGGSDGVTQKTTCTNDECVTTVTTCVDGTCTTVEKPAEGGSEAESDGAPTVCSILKSISCILVLMLSHWELIAF